MNSKYMKCCLSANFRFKKQAKLIATEAGRFNSDFLAIIRDQLCEIEIKVSKSDLNNDFKKPKHRIYKDNRHPWIPNTFYFAVPENLVEYAISKCVDKPYGVIKIVDQKRTVTGFRRLWKTCTKESAIKIILSIYEDVSDIVLVEDGGIQTLKFSYTQYVPHTDCVSVVKKAKKLHTRPPNKDIIRTMIARLSSEMSRLRIDEQLKLNE